MMIKFGSAVFVGSLFLFAAQSPGSAEERWSYPVRRIDPPRITGVETPVLPDETQFESLDANSVKKHKICLLLPQTQDTIFLAYMYGAVSEAQRLGQSLTIFDAGGFENANQQRGQFENCVTLGANIIIMESSLPGGWKVPVKDAQANGIKIIETVDPIDVPSDGRSLGTYSQNGRLMADAVKSRLATDKMTANVLILPGAAGAKFVEDTVVGIKAGLEGTDVTILNVLYGGLDAPSQLKLIEDALVAYPNVDYILGNGIAVSQAAKVLRQRKLSGKIKLVSSWIDPDIAADIKAGDVLAAVTESSVMVTKIAVNLGVAASEGQPLQDIIPAARLVTTDNIDDQSISDANYAPDGWKPVFRVE